MRPYLATLLLLAQSVTLTIASSCTCFDKDHCLRAVAQCPRKGCLQQKQDCSSFLHTTVTPTTTKTVTVPGRTGTVTATQRVDQTHYLTKTFTTNVPYTFTDVEVVQVDETVTTATETVYVTATTNYETDEVTITVGTDTETDSVTVTDYITIPSGTTTVYQQKRTAAATSSPKIPVYAKSYCKNASAYGSACGCLGIHRSTVTAPRATVTKTQTGAVVTVTQRATYTTIHTVTQLAVATVTSGTTDSETTTVVNTHNVGATVTSSQYVDYTTTVTREVDATTTISDTATATVTVAQATYTGFNNDNTGSGPCGCEYHVKSGQTHGQPSFFTPTFQTFKECQNFCDSITNCFTFDWNSETGLCRALSDQISGVDDPTLTYSYGYRLQKDCQNSACRPS